MGANDTLKQLQDIWRAGGLVAFTDIQDGKPMDALALDSESGLIFELFGAISQSHREWKKNWPDPWALTTSRKSC